MSCEDRGLCVAGAAINSSKDIECTGETSSPVPIPIPDKSGTSRRKKPQPPPPHKSKAIKALHTQQELDAFVAEERTAIVEFVASWCGACKGIQPLLDDMMAEQSLSCEEGEGGVAQVVCDKNRETKKLAAALGVGSYPVFVVYENGAITDRWNGADRGKLEKAFERIGGGNSGGDKKKKNKKKKGGRRSAR